MAFWVNYEMDVLVSEKKTTCVNLNKDGPQRQTDITIQTAEWFIFLLPCQLTLETRRRAQKLHSPDETATFLKVHFSEREKQILDFHTAEENQQNRGLFTVLIQELEDRASARQKQDLYISFLIPKAEEGCEKNPNKNILKISACSVPVIETIIKSSK